MTPDAVDTMKDRVRDEDWARSPAGESDAHDKALMVRIAQGDEGALRDLIEKHQGAVYGTIAKMLGDLVAGTLVLRTSAICS